MIAMMTKLNLLSSDLLGRSQVLDNLRSQSAGQRAQSRKSTVDVSTSGDFYASFPLHVNRRVMADEKYKSVTEWLS